MAKDGPTQFIDTLKLSDEQWSELSDELKRFSSSDGGQRKHKRIPFRTLSQIAVTIQKPDESWSKYIVRSRDLSPGGIGFIHGSYVHTGSPCRVILKDLSGELACLEGVVRRCDLLLGRAHIIGVKFNEEIVLTNFISPNETDADERLPEAG